MRVRRERIPAVLAAGVLLVAVSLAVGVASATGRPTIVAHTTEASATGPTVVAIGDSIMEGHGLHPGQAWPALLAQEYGWRLTNLASDGSGFVTPGDNGDTFADQVAVAARLNPSIVFVSGSSNDLGSDDTMIAGETAATIRALHAALPRAEILAVSPVWNDKNVPPQLDDIDLDVVRAVSAVGGRALDIGQPLFGKPALMQSDDVHPTPAGQQVIAAAVSKALQRPAA
ncbi:SGNH/GDSL hydrolase family protein [Diaminobutyricibacter sp. McL0608]|uniref:SGNH/GDSL hydrolase family protein n=1 Tax=Leifsonia sp. McL0608 TaxID=3143537 RepID=UPI0031F2EA9E